MNTKVKTKQAAKKSPARMNPEINAIPCPEDAWENRELGADEAFVQVASDELEARVQASLNMQMVSIRLPVELIESLKLISQYRGIGYQPLIRDLLVRFANNELRTMAQELYEADQAKAVLVERIQRDCA